MTGSGHNLSEGTISSGIFVVGQHGGGGKHKA
jgi:hypothetical protein